MSNFLRFMKKFLQAHDPAALRERDAARLDSLRDRIVRTARMTPQEAPAPMRREVLLPRFAFRMGRGAELALSVALLMLGLWVGQSLDRATIATYGDETQNEEALSVVAMATPWNGWIEGGN